MRWKAVHLLGLTGILACVFIVSCKHETAFFQSNNNNFPPDSTTSVGSNSIACDPTKVYFQQQVLPILISNCAQSGCHDNITHKEGIILTSYNSTMSTVEIKPGNPADSKLYKIISKGEMPPQGYTALNQSQKDLIYNWIAQGAENLVCENSCGDTLNITYSLSVKPIIDNKCLGCHSGISAQGGIDLSTYSGVKIQVANGKLSGSVNWIAGYSAMPKGGNKLTICELTQISKWINMGAPNN